MAFKRTGAAVLGWLAMLMLVFMFESPSHAQSAELQRLLPLSDLQSGLRNYSRDIQQLASDDGANPAFLWVGRGQELWTQDPRAGGASCASCHGRLAESMKGVAARYPRWDASGKTLINLADRINRCRTSHQLMPTFAAESDDLLSLSAAIALQSRGLPAAAGLETSLLEGVQRGQALYTRRMGHMNLACTHCHDRKWGRRLGGEIISQGHGIAYPAYRFEWQRVGSLQRRLRACFAGVRAEMPAYGDQQLVELELYLKWRAAELPLEAPGVRR